MKNFLNKITPEWSLRLSLGAMYLYSSIDILRHPTAWFWAVRPLFKYFPLAMQSRLTSSDFMKSFLMVQGLIELVFAIIFLAWFLPKCYAKWVAGFTVLEMAGILLTISIDAVTFRDIGLLGASFALFLLLRNSTVSVESEKKKEFKPIISSSDPMVQTFDQFIGSK